MKIYHIEYDTDEEAQSNENRMDSLDGVLEAYACPAYGHGSAYVVAVTQDSFDPTSFAAEFVLMHEDKPEEKQSEIEVEELEHAPDTTPLGE